MKTCVCGRPVTFRPNSTIQPKFCPACALDNLKARTAQKEALSQTIRKKVNKYATDKKISSKKRKNKSWMDTADTWFSRYIRIVHGIVDTGGEVFSKDIITGKYYRAERIDCGHYHSRAEMGTRYDPDNCRPQNRSSNRFSGEADKKRFKRNLIEQIGEDNFNALEDKAQSVNKLSEDDLKDISDTYRKIVNALVKERWIKKWW